jgi:predicted DNA binding CopG/RHH family protein
MKKSKIKKIPVFKSEDAEREFWDKADVFEYFDMDKGIKNVKFPNLKPSTETISIRFPKFLLDEVKIQANKKDVPYQSLIKLYLSEMVKLVRDEGKEKYGKLKK